MKLLLDTHALLWFAEDSPLLQARGFSILDLNFVHYERLLTLAPHHRDPFDRLLIAQAQHERMTLVSRDTDFRTYDVPVLW